MPDKSARTVFTSQVFQACKEWEQKHQKSINSGNLAEAAFNLKPQFQDIAGDDLATLIRRYARIPEPAGNHPEPIGIIKETYLGSIKINGKEVSVVEES